MMPYFFEFNRHLLSDSAKQYFVDHSLKNLDTFTKSKVIDTDVYDKHNYITGPILKNHEEFGRLLESFAIKPAYSIVMMHHPHTVIPRHYDKKYGRDTILSIPLYPAVGYSKLEFWTDRETPTPCATILYEKMLPVVFNTTELHTLVLGDSVRLNIQICFAEPIQQIYDAHTGNTLFK
jgi:hypothetical protein